MPPAVASPAIDYLPIIVILLRTNQAQIPLYVILGFCLPFLSVHVVPRAVSFDLVIEIFIKFPKFFDAIAHTVIEKFVAFRLFVALAVDLEE